MAKHYGEAPLDEEEVGMSLVPVESRIPVPIDVDRSIEEWKDYQRLCREILDENDYAEIRGIKARKRSGWAKLRRFYNITLTVIEQERTPPFTEWEPGQAFAYRFLVRGCLGNRVEEGDGACEATDLLCPHCKGNGCDKCKQSGYSIPPTEHNVRSKALTRAKNRVTSDLIGGGEVSAEELETGEPLKEKPKPQARHWIENKEIAKKFWGWANETLGLTGGDTHKALGVESVKDFQGSMAEAKKTIEEWLASQIDEKAEQGGKP